MFYNESKQTLLYKKHLYKKAAAGKFKYHIPTNAGKHKIATYTKILLISYVSYSLALV